MIEEFDDVLEDIANQVGVYGTEGAHDDKCKCRPCFVSKLEERLRDAMDVERGGVRVHRRVIRARKNPHGSSSMTELQRVMTEYFKVLTEKERAFTPVPWTPMPVQAEFVPESPEPVVSPFTSDKNPVPVSDDDYTPF